MWPNFISLIYYEDLLDMTAETILRRDIGPGSALKSLSVLNLAS